MVYDSFSQQETEDLGCILAQNADVGSFFALIGDLGAGKTAFTRGFARGLGISGSISSPTFAIVNEYDSGRLPLYHFDVYRIQNAENMQDTGFEDYFYSNNGIVLVEWANLIKDILPPHAKILNFQRDLGRDEGYRKITVTGG
ncbi:MAG: tRNA (adenosine(37)-N6)-threonylcarbamoyltransferase complex ATPase subunit type 1 TsaE [Defluviitaleaceae bacterium]|nr:tRNA (adenosine(37)-N6)-threonylcarbamoyltransferase complex ATPase subunit type 1 TsaE [Defluviitaleaceae bacterium]